MWRLIGRVCPTTVDRAVNGLDCYLFTRRFGERYLQVLFLPVRCFWGGRDPLAGPFVLKSWER